MTPCDVGFGSANLCRFAGPYLVPPRSGAVIRRGDGQASQLGGKAVLVTHILREKGREVVQVPRDATLTKTAGLLTRHQIGAVLVLDETGAPAGILSERDIVKAIAREGAAALSCPVSSWMSSPVATCEESDTVEYLAEKMTRGRIRHLPVVKDRQVVGLVSIGDVVKSRIAETVVEAEVLKNYIAVA